ncbi:hypothetical protein [Pedobacter nutrimenti]|uniref:Uncharacterized protein n=1 Tax=Pedobacter nutrimenti TaxID=1241337 RepID=A0A318UKY0_9SPHI|nr:hypothetical protein [Pedobacter nutrimenti]PYF69367.1 hypothetical protein B0O44_1105 [Pedobacter nutrimenti]
MSLSQVDLRTKFNHEYSERFNKESWCIAELYWSYLENYQVGKVKKCLIVVSDDWGSELHYYTSRNDCKGVNLEINFSEYFSYDSYHRKEALLKVVHSGLTFIATKEKWEIDPLLDAFNSCIKVGLNYKFLVQNKFKTSPNRKHKLGLWCEWNIDEFKVFWILLDKDKKQIKKELFIDENPSFGEFIYYVNFKWLNDNIVLVTDDYRSEKRKWEIIVS